MTIGDALPQSQQRVLRFLGTGFKAAALSGLIGLASKWTDAKLVVDTLRLVHQYVSYVFLGLVILYFGLHLRYVLTLRGGYVFKNTKVTGITVAVVGVLVVAVALQARPLLLESPLSLSAHVFGALLIPVLFQKHVIRAVGSRGN